MSQDLVLRLDIYRKLEKHRGCVNTISFNTNGDILVSGSDDKRVILWDWETGHIKLSFHSGHTNNVFQAKIMPCTDDRSIVTCAADGQVCHLFQSNYCMKMKYHCFIKMCTSFILECKNVIGHNQWALTQITLPLLVPS